MRFYNKQDLDTEQGEEDKTTTAAISTPLTQLKISNNSEMRRLFPCGVDHNYLILKMLFWKDIPNYFYVAILPQILLKDNWIIVKMFSYDWEEKKNLGI